VPRTLAERRGRWTIEALRFIRFYIFCDLEGKDRIMAEDNQPQAVEGQQGVQVLLDERDLRTVYSNAYRIHTASEEVVLDLGFNMPNPNQQPGQQQQLLFKVTDRVIMSYPASKRLALSLSQLVKRYEQQFGEIPQQPGQKR